MRHKAWTSKSKTHKATTVVFFFDLLIWRMLASTLGPLFRTRKLFTALFRFVFEARYFFRTLQNNMFLSTRYAFGLLLNRRICHGLLGFLLIGLILSSCFTLGWRLPGPPRVSDFL
jgi:hypothetical protein